MDTAINPVDPCATDASPNARPTRIGLALGGGAVRGAAHIGVLAALDEAGLAPAVLTGTSAGTLVGALYAAGISPAEIGSLARTLRWSRLVHPSMNRRSLLETTRLFAFLNDALGGRDFDALARTFAAVACELTTGATVVLRDGPVASAVLASAAIPGVFPPVERDDRLLVDGGLVDLVPAALARSLGADIVVAVDVSGPMPHRRPRTMLEILVAATTLQPRGCETAGRRRRPGPGPGSGRVRVLGTCPNPRVRTGRPGRGHAAVPLLRALVAAAEERRTWQRSLAGMSITVEAHRADAVYAAG